MYRKNQLVYFSTGRLLIVAYFYGNYVKLPETDEEWGEELCGFIETMGCHVLGHGMVSMSMCRGMGWFPCPCEFQTEK